MGRVFLAIAGTAVCLALLLSLKSRGTTAGLPPAPAIQHAPAQSPRPAASKGHPVAAGSRKPGSSGAATATVAGDVTQTIYGPVQVKITVRHGRITAASVPVFPDGSPHDQQVSSYALPQLIQETIAADSASINAVSGATYTSQGYITSLQSAIDRAGL
jgi:uncharacterized protein with FMN-binding domain